MAEAGAHYVQRGRLEAFGERVKSFVGLLGDCAMLVGQHEWQTFHPPFVTGPVPTIICVELRPTMFYGAWRTVYPFLRASTI